MAYKVLIGQKVNQTISLIFAALQKLQTTVE